MILVYISDYPLVRFTYNLISVPVVNSGLLIDNSRALFNAKTVGDTSPVVLFAVMFAALFLATQVLMYISSFTLIFVNIYANPFAADLDYFFFIKTTGNFFGLQSCLIRDLSS